MELFTHIPIGLYIIAADGRPLEVNDWFLSILGLTSSEQVALLGREGFPGALPMAACVPHLSASDRVVGVISHWQKPDGRVITLRQSLSVTRDAGGCPVRYQGTVEELTDTSLPEENDSLMERRYQRVVDQTTDALLIDDRDGQVVYANPAFLKLFGLQESDLKSLALEDYIAPEWRTVLRERHERRIRGESVPSVFHYVGMRKDGSRIPLETSVVAVIEHGQLVGTQSTIRDITERERLQDNLRLLHRTLDALVTQLPLAIIGLDQRGEVTMWNPAAERILGWSRDEILGHPCPGLHPHTGEIRYRDTLRAIISGERACIDFETRWPRRDGSEIDVAVWTILWHESEQALTNILVLADITARKAARADYRRLFDNDHDAILLIEPDSLTILEANQQAELLYTGGRRSLRGESLTSLYENPDQIVADCQAVVAGTVHRRREYTQRDGNGRQIDVEVNLALLNYAGNQVITSHNRDVTEHKQMVQRSLQSRKMESLGQLAGGVAHDFNNVLTALMGYPTLIKLSLEPQHPAIEYLEQIHALAHRAAALSRQLLTFSRQHVLRSERLIPGAIVNGMRELLRRLIREDIDLQIEADDNQLPISADSGQLEQLLMNLAVNARDAMPTGGTLRISVADVHLQPVDGNDLPVGEHVLITVSDTGIGMNTQVREKLFEPFFTTKTVGQGTGLGLATVQGIVKQHNGTIRVKSTLGRGSKFQIYLPASSGTPKEGALASDEDSSAGNTVARPLTILLIEDDDPVREFVHTVLTQAGHQLHEAINGVQAQEVIEKHNVSLDLIVSDLVMPKRGGGEVASYVAVHYPNIPILFMSGYTNEPALRRILEKPDTAYLQKPFSPQELLTAVNRIANRGPTSASSQQEQSVRIGPYTMLLVDDSAVNRRLGRLYLESLGHRVDVATNGQEAIDAVQMKTYDMIFMDCHMPVMDGYDATRLIRALPDDSSAVPIIAITGYLAPGELPRCREVGMNDVIAKPFQKIDLQRVIETWRTR